MKRILHKFKFIAFVLLILAFTENINSQCTITGTRNASTLNPNPCTTLTGCDGILYIGNGSTATSLVMNANLDLRCYTIYSYK